MAPLCWVYAGRSARRITEPLYPTQARFTTGSDASYADQHNYWPPPVAREQCETPRALRELIILRTAQLTLSQYEWHHHRRMAAEAGVDEHQVAELAMWPTSPAFTDAERAALAFTDALAEGEVPDEVNAALAEHFDEQARVELTLTASFYFGVPRLLNALRVPLEVAPASAATSDGKDKA